MEVSDISNNEVNLFSDLRPDVRGQEVLPAGQQEDEGVPAGQDHDGAGAGVPHPQHPQAHPRAVRGTRLQQAVLCVSSLFLANTFRPDSIS